MTSGPNGTIGRQPVRDHSLLNKENNLNFGSKLTLGSIATLAQRRSLYLKRQILRIFPKSGIIGYTTIQQEAKLWANFIYHQLH